MSSPAIRRRQPPAREIHRGERQGDHRVPRTPSRTARAAQRAASGEQRDDEHALRRLHSARRADESSLAARAANRPARTLAEIRPRHARPAGKRSGKACPLPLPGDHEFSGQLPGRDLSSQNVGISTALYRGPKADIRPVIAHPGVGALGRPLGARTGTGSGRLPSARAPQQGAGSAPPRPSRR